MEAPQELIGNQAAAAYVGVSVNSWRPYVARGQAPPPDRHQVESGHALPVWRQETLDKWLRNRPGPGARTDLEARAGGRSPT